MEVPAQSHPSPQPSKLAKAMDVTMATAMDVAFGGQRYGKVLKEDISRHEALKPPRTP